MPTLLVKLELTRWGRDVLFAAVELLQEIEEADEVLITDDVLAAAQKLRAALARR